MAKTGRKILLLTAWMMFAYANTVLLTTGDRSAVLAALPAGANTPDFGSSATAGLVAAAKIAD